MHKLTPHIHQKEIIAWAGGATIQFNNPANSFRDWEDCPHDNPCWAEDVKYRVKPREFKVG